MKTVKQFLGYPLFMVLLILIGCHAPNQFNAQNSQLERKKIPEYQYFVDADGNGTYSTQVFLDSKPEPVQGRIQWMKDFYKTIKYPPNAREKGIEGIVILSVVIDESGQVQRVSIDQSLLPECDEEAKRAFISSTLDGFTPLNYNSKNVGFLMKAPVGFWLE
ncbi:MAG: energy transducer TonB [Bacteroidota bacterium]